MTNLLFIVHSGVIGGPGRSLLRIVEKLPASYNSRIIVPWEGEYAALLRQKQINHSVYPLRLRNLPRLLLDSSQCAIVYGNSVNYPVSVAMQAANWMRRPTIWHIREILEDPVTNPQSYKYLSHIRQQMLKANALIAVSKAAAMATTRLLEGHRTPHIIHNGVNMSDYDIERSTARQYVQTYLGLESENILIAQVGHLIAHKNQMESIQAFAQVVTDYPKARLIFLGDADKDTTYTAKVHQQIKLLGLEYHVIFAGFQDHIEFFLRGMDIQLHPSMKDAHPRAVIEGMAATLPVVAYDVDGIGETMVSGETGYLVPSGDIHGLSKALATLLEDTALRKQMGKAGHYLVETRFTAQETARKIQDVIEFVLVQHSKMQKP